MARNGYILEEGAPLRTRRRLSTPMEVGHAPGNRSDEQSARYEDVPTGKT
jgi:hypothetical protein